MTPWYRVVTPRKEVREGRSFDPSEFAIALDQVVAKSASTPNEYRDPKEFFARTVFTNALMEHLGLVLRRLNGETMNTAPVLTLLTQFGGGKTHALTAIYHMIENARKASELPGIDAVIRHAGVAEVPRARTAVFVGMAWDPQPGAETPWIDIARQLAGDEGVEILGPSAKDSPPGTETLRKIVAAAGGSVVLLFDEVLNYVSRHRGSAEQFHSFLHTLTEAMRNTDRSVAVISLPRSQVEMTDWDLQWQNRITKLVHRVARDLIANDESEISEVVRRRLFENLGSEEIRAEVSKTYAGWCFERRDRLPAEWAAVDTALTETKARERLRQRFAACYPFHPATISVFQRKWQSLPQYQQTRGTLALLAQWISWAYRTQHEKARKEPLITLGSAPLDVRDFRSVVLGMLNEQRLEAAITVDIAGDNAHARTLDAGTNDALADIHRRTATAIFFESTGGQADRVAHLPELRFALGEPDVDTASVDNAADALERRSFYIRKVGSDGFRIHHKPTLKKVWNDRCASLDPDGDVRPAMEKAVREEFDKARTMPVMYYPTSGTDVPDVPRLTIVVVNPDTEWSGNSATRDRMIEWTKRRGSSDRLYPGSVIWCVKKPGRDLRNKVESWLAWRRVSQDIASGALGNEVDPEDRREADRQVKASETDLRDEVWASYRYVMFADRGKESGIDVIDLGAGHASSGDSLAGRIVAAMKANALLSESPGAGYIQRNWPPAFKELGAWPLRGLRQSLIDGTLTRVLDPDRFLREKTPEFVRNGDFGFASGLIAGGGYERIWFMEEIPPDEIAFEEGVFLLTKERAEALKVPPGVTPPVTPPGGGAVTPPPTPPVDGGGPKPPLPTSTTLRVKGSIPTEVWNRVGTSLIPKLKAGRQVSANVELVVTVRGDEIRSVVSDVNQILRDLGISGNLTVEEEQVRTT